MIKQKQQQKKSTQVYLSGVNYVKCLQVTIEIVTWYYSRNHCTQSDVSTLVKEGYLYFFNKHMIPAYTYRIPNLENET